MENEAGRDEGEDINLVFDLARAAALYTHVAALKNADAPVAAPTTNGNVIPFHPGVAPGHRAAPLERGRAKRAGYWRSELRVF